MQIVAGLLLLLMDDKWLKKSAKFHGRDFEERPINNDFQYQLQGQFTFEFLIKIRRHVAL